MPTPPAITRHGYVLVPASAVVTVDRSYSVQPTDDGYIKIAIKDDKLDTQYVITMSAEQFGAAVVGATRPEATLWTFVKEEPVVAEPPRHAASGMTDMERAEDALKTALSVIEGFAQLESMTDEEYANANIPGDWWDDDYDKIATLIREWTDRRKP